MKPRLPAPPAAAPNPLGAKNRRRAERPLATIPAKSWTDPGVRPTRALTQRTRDPRGRAAAAPEGPGQPGETGLPTSPAACSSAAHRPKSLGTAWRGRRRPRGEQGGCFAAGKRLALPRRLHWVGPPVPALPLPGREPARPRLSAESRPTDSRAPTSLRAWPRCRRAP